MTKKLTGAALLMEKFIEEGKYPQLMQSKGQLKILTKLMKDRLISNESKRKEFKRYGLVGRFTAKKIYETDYLALNEYLYDIGLLSQVVEIDKKINENILYSDMIQDFKLPDTYYIKPSFNKAGQSLNKIDENFSDEVKGLYDMARRISILKPQIKTLQIEYEQLKREFFNQKDVQALLKKSPELRKPLKHNYGSISLVKNKTKYDISAIHDYMGEWLLIEYGTPNSEMLQKFILNGTITQSEINQFRTIKDIRLDFSVMTLEDELKILEMLDHKNQKAAENRRRA